jgi:FMN phosphatase YigB (HAD superfamily)
VKRVVSFDLDGTLVDGAYGNMVWLEGIPVRYAQRHSIPVDEAKRVVRAAYDSVGEDNVLWYDMPYWLKRFSLTISVPALLDEYEAHIRVLPHVRKALERLSRRYKLVIASNAARVFVEKELHQSGLAKYFHHTFSATSDFKMVKREAAFYRVLCDVLHVEPSEVVHIGDHAVFDVEVPLRIGLDAYHYSPNGESNGRIIKDFRELSETL